MSRSRIRTSIAFGIAAAALSLAGAASAQITVEELTVLGRAGPAGHPETVSYPVGFADLDLRTSPGRSELDRRIRITAKYVCAKLAKQDHTGPNEGCVKAALSDAREQARRAKLAASHATAPWKPGRTWTPPPPIG